jgi:hypothetical protein
VVGRVKSLNSEVKIMSARTQVHWIRRIAEVAAALALLLDTEHGHPAYPE